MEETQLVVPPLASITANQRKSGLKAPTMILTGHEGEVFSVEFSPDGKQIATGSFDKTILLYSVYGDCDNWSILRGHKNAVLEVHWSSDQEKLYSCSADMTLAIWDVTTGQRIKKLSGHLAIINSCQISKTSPALLFSGADDGTTKVWDLRTRRCVQTFEHSYQIFSVSYNDLSQKIYAGCLDNTIRIYDMRSHAEVELLVGHSDAVTSVDIGCNGTRLLSNAMDQTVRIWNIEPYCDTPTRCTAIMTGSTHNFEKKLLRARWSPDGLLCGAGSSDRNVYIWEAFSQNLLYKLPGHNGSVNEVCFHPSEPIIASAGSDKLVFLGELGS